MRLREGAWRVIKGADRVDRKLNLDPYAGPYSPLGPGHRGILDDQNPEEVRFEAARAEKRRWPFLNRLFNVVPEDEVGKGPVEPGRPDY